MHRTAFTALAAAAVATGAIGIPAADAATLEQLINTNLQFTFEDDNAEDIAVDNDGNGLLDVGDTLRGVFSFPQLLNSSSGESFPLNGTTNSAVHGLFEIQVESKNQVSPASGITPALYNFTFEPHNGFAAEVDGVDGAMVGIWESDTPLNPYGCGSKEACEDGATNGALRMVLGIGEDGEGLWGASSAPDDLGALDDVALAANTSTYSFRIDVLEDDLDTLPFIDITEASIINGELVDFPAEVVGSGQILGPVGNGPYPASSDIDMEMAVVPIPAALPLFLAGLGALGMIGWRRNAA